MELRILFDRVKILGPSPMLFREILSAQIDAILEPLCVQIADGAVQIWELPDARVRTVMLAISEGSIEPAGRELARGSRWLPGRGTKERMGDAGRF